MSRSDRAEAIDAAIMSVVRPRWLKVARIVSDAEKALEGQAPPVGSVPTDQQREAARDALLDAIAERIQGLRTLESSKAPAIFRIGAIAK